MLIWAPGPCLLCPMSLGCGGTAGHSRECGKDGLLISRKKGEKGNAKVLKSLSRACSNDLTSFYQHLSPEGCVITGWQPRFHHTILGGQLMAKLRQTLMAH